MFRESLRRILNWRSFTGFLLIGESFRMLLFWPFSPMKIYSGVTKKFEGMMSME